MGFDTSRPSLKLEGMRDGLNSSYERFFTDVMKAAAKFCKVVFNSKEHIHVFSALKCGLWYSLIHKDSKVIQDSGKSESGLEYCGSRG